MLSKIYNFSHPLTQQQLDDITDKYHLNTGDIEIENIKVQLDTNEVHRLAHEAGVDDYDYDENVGKWFPISK